MLDWHVAAARHQHEVHALNLFTKHDRVYAFWLEYTFNRTYGDGQGWPECFQLFWPHGGKPGRMASQVHQHHAWRSWRQKRPQAPELILEIRAAWWRRSDERTYRTRGSHDCLPLRVLRSAITD